MELVDLQQARNRASGTMIRTRLGEMHTRVMGSGPPVVLVHGVTESTETFFELQDSLSHLATVHAIDLPGHGLTDIPKAALSLEEMARWVEAYMDAARIDRAVIVGWSMGGGVALSLAVQAPERCAALVLLGSIGVSMSMPFTLGLLRLPGVGEAMVRAARSPKWRRALLQGVFHPSFTAHERVFDRYWEPWFVRGRVRYLRALLRSLDAAPLEPRLGEIRVPTWIVHGASDGVVPLDVGRRIAALVPGARLHVLPRTGHSPHLEEPAVVRGVIRNALEITARDAP